MKVKVKLICKNCGEKFVTYAPYADIHMCSDGYIGYGEVIGVKFLEE